MTLRVAIVEDEGPARHEMRRLLAAYEGVEVTGEASTRSAARGLLQRTRPDVVFLDIRLGHESGFDLLDDVDTATAVVFVTAYDAHAVRAFEAGALDYLMKPVEPERLARTIERLMAWRAARESGTSAATRAPAFTSDRWIFLGAGEDCEFVAIEEIACIDADGKETVITTADGRTRTEARSLESWRDRLPADFLRIHRSTIVNLKHVERVEPWSNYSHRVHVRGRKEPAVMSRRYSLEARRLLR